MPAKIDVDATINTNSIETDAQVGNPVNVPEVISVNGQSGNVVITLENLGFQNPDWSQDDSEQLDYIKNRPAIKAGSGANSIAENGAGASARGNYSHAEGGGTAADGAESHAEGSGTTASGTGSHAEGGGTKAIGSHSHAEGNGTTASGSWSHAEGGGTTASGPDSHAEGGGTAASGTGSHAEGEGTRAISNCAHAEGGVTTASGSCSHAEGSGTTASGSWSHAEGGGTTASSPYSHAEGMGTKASSECQHVEGKYNAPDSNGVYAHVIGNGTSDSNRSNAHTVDWAGNAWYEGRVAAGTTANPADPVEANDLVTKHYIDQDISSRVRAVDAEMAESRFNDNLPEGVSTPPISSEIFEVTGIPTYVSDPAEYSSYGLTEPGWYAFAEIRPKDGVEVNANTITVEGAAGYVTATSDYIYVAVKFDVAAMSQAVTINWGAYTETIIFQASDLAIRNLDQRVTFYVYDADPFATWEFKRSADATFVGTKYYTEENGTYTQAAVKAHELIPADTYYTHSYAATTDETFQDGVTYYELVSGSYEPAEVIVGETVPASTYYVDQWTLTTDTRFVGTRYYVERDGEYEQIAVKAGETCSYYTKVVDYPLTEDTAFVGTEYWTPDESDLGYSRAAVKAGEEVPEGEYFTHAYSKLTAAGKFAEGVRYYKLVGTEYELQEVTVGASYAKNVYYIDQWTPATGNFIGTAYWINEGGEWSQAAVIAGELIPADTYHLRVISWPQATEETFAAGETYYTCLNGEYNVAEVSADSAIPLYLVHDKVIISGLVRNVTYRLNQLVDCPMEFILPEIDDETHGAWYEIRCRHDGAYSMTLTPPEGVKIATEHTQKETAGINMINLHYTVVDGVKIWRFMNTHSSIPA